VHQDFGQQWLNGAQSVCNPRVNGGKDRLPLWVLTVWWDMVHFVEVQTSLKKALEAAENLVTEDKEVLTRFPTFRDVKWNETFNHGGINIPAHEFTRWNRV
jgi:hypothetical protein